MQILIGKWSHYTHINVFASIDKIKLFWISNKKFLKKFPSNSDWKIKTKHIHFTRQSTLQIMLSLLITRSFQIPFSLHFFPNQTILKVHPNDCKGICCCCYYQLISKNMQLILVCSDCQYLIVIIMKVILLFIVTNSLCSYWLIHFLNNR